MEDKAINARVTMITEEGKQNDQISNKNKSRMKDNEALISFK